MRYLITGGAGFIGSHLAEKLLSAGHYVSVVDDLSTGSIRNIEHLKNDDKFSYTIDSIMNVPLLAELVDACDAVFHLAAAVGVKKIVEDPVGTIVTNIRGTEIILELASKKSRKVLITSTSEVYGKSTAFPFNEDGDLVMGCPTRPRWSYACSKAIDEFLALAYGKANGLPVVIVRLFNTVGPRQTGRYGMVIPRFVEQGLRGEDITVYGSGEQTRCFAHVRDVVGALADLMGNQGSAGGIFNIGSCEEVSINHLAGLVIEKTGRRSKVHHISFSEAYDDNFEDMDRRVPDISKAKNLIGYSPQLTLNDIINDVIVQFSS